MPAFACLEAKPILCWWRPKRKLSNAKIAPISLSRGKPPLIGLQLYADQYSEEKGITFESLQ
jgi:hypothetical protein